MQMVLIELRHVERNFHTFVYEGAWRLGKKERGGKRSKSRLKVGEWGLEPGSPSVHSIHCGTLRSPRIANMDLALLVIMKVDLSRWEGRRYIIEHVLILIYNF